MTKREKAALETLTTEERYAAGLNRARLDVDRRWLRILLRLAKRSAAQDTAVARAERAVVRAAMRFGLAWEQNGALDENYVTAMSTLSAVRRLQAARAKARHK